MGRRLFFGLWPSERQREALRDPIKGAIGGLEGVPTLRGNWHVTLVFLGDFPEHKLDELQAAAEDIEVKPFRLRMDRLEFWPRPKIACLVGTRVPQELQALQEALAKVAAQFGHAPDEHMYRPHITVARNARPFIATPLAQPIMLEWSGFVLLESTSTSQGVQYSPLKQGSTGNS